VQHALRTLLDTTGSITTHPGRLDVARGDALVWTLETRLNLPMPAHWELVFPSNLFGSSVYAVNASNASANLRLLVSPNAHSGDHKYAVRVVIAAGNARYEEDPWIVVR
jgi:hypothetical protein